MLYDGFSRGGWFDYKKGKMKKSVFTILFKLYDY